ncbi:hypothetical protein JT55_04525 [Rhodovulum sp. NI22]|nr:hypothetical protein JT55_04525 [Rhodovulum sp. NI22]
MSNPESFIEEVTEEVRRERLFGLFRRYGWIAVVAVLLLVGGTAYNEWQKTRARNSAQALGDGIMAALDQPGTAARVAALDAVAVTGDAAALVALLAAGEQIDAGETEAGVARLQALADATDLPLLYRQLATLKLILAQGTTVAADERRAALEPLSAPGQPFRPLALEQLALIEAETGAADAALELLREVLNDAQASPGLRQRASQLIVALGGSLGDA